MSTDTAHDSHVGKHRRSAQATGVPTVGVEEELILTRGPGWSYRPRPRSFANVGTRHAS